MASLFSAHFLLAADGHCQEAEEGQVPSGRDLVRRVAAERRQAGRFCENGEWERRWVSGRRARRGSAQQTMSTWCRSHLVAVPAGASLQEVLVESAVLRSEDGAAPPVTFGAQGGFDFGIDPNEDPELAMALRVSLEEQRQRQEQQARQGDPPAPQAPPAQQPPSADAPPAPAGNFAAMSEEEQMELALRMSLMPAQDALAEAAPAPAPPVASLPAASSSVATADVMMNDPQALEELLNTLPGVDTTSDAFRRAKERQEQVPTPSVSALPSLRPCARCRASPTTRRPPARRKSDLVDTPPALRVTLLASLP